MYDMLVVDFYMWIFINVDFNRDF